jgi:hypothetical protein
MKNAAAESTATEPSLCCYLLMLQTNPEKRTDDSRQEFRPEESLRCLFKDSAGDRQCPANLGSNCRRYISCRGVIFSAGELEIDHLQSRPTCIIMIEMKGKRCLRASHSREIWWPSNRRINIEKRGQRKRAKIGGLSEGSGGRQSHERGERVSMFR